MTILGAVLAGGLSTRFGSDKAAALLDGVALLDHALAALGAQVDAVVVCGRVVAGVPSLGDRPAPGLGPLGGIAAALHFAAAHGHSGVVTVPCDAPRIPADLVARLVGEGARYAASQPVIGWWPAALAGALDAFVASDARRALRGWAAAADAVPVDLAVANVNTRADLARLARAVAGRA